MCSLQLSRAFSCLLSFFPRSVLLLKSPSSQQAHAMSNRRSPYEQAQPRVRPPNARARPVSNYTRPAPRMEFDMQSLSNDREKRGRRDRHVARSASVASLRYDSPRPASASQRRHAPERPTYVLSTDGRPWTEKCEMEQQLIRRHMKDSQVHVRSLLYDVVLCQVYKHGASPCYSPSRFLRFVHARRTPSS